MLLHVSPFIWNSMPNVRTLLLASNNYCSQHSGYDRQSYSFPQAYGFMCFCIIATTRSVFNVVRLLRPCSSPEFLRRRLTYLIFGYKQLTVYVWLCQSISTYLLAVLTILPIRDEHAQLHTSIKTILQTNCCFSLHFVMINIDQMGFLLFNVFK